MVAQVIAWWWRRRRALQGRHSCIAQGASPGLIVSTYFLSSAGAALSQRMQVHEPQRHKSNALAVSAAPTELNSLCLCIPRVSFRALPSLHPGLSRSIVPTALVISLNFDATALGLNRVCLAHKLMRLPCSALIYIFVFLIMRKI